MGWCRGPSVRGLASQRNMLAARGGGRRTGVSILIFLTLHPVAALDRFVCAQYNAQEMSALWREPFSYDRSFVVSEHLPILAAAPPMEFDPARILAVHYRRLLAERMADRPFLNPALQVATTAFRRLGGDWLGAW